MRFEVWEYRCEVTESDGVFIGQVYEYDEHLCTLTADSLDGLRSEFNQWLSG